MKNQVTSIIDVVLDEHCGFCIKCPIYVSRFRNCEMKLVSIFLFAMFTILKEKKNIITIYICDTIHTIEICNITEAFYCSNQIS